MKTSGRDFRQAIDEKYTPVWKELDDVYKALVDRANQLGDRFLSRLLPQLWRFEAYQVKAVGVWILSIQNQRDGKYRDLQRMLARQNLDEMKHTRIYADCCIDKGWVKSEYELVLSPYSQMVPAWASHLGSMDILEHYPPPVMAAHQYLSEGNALRIFRAFARGLKDPRAAVTWGCQEADESRHVGIGRYAIDKYADTTEIQDQIWWYIDCGESNAKAYFPQWMAVIVEEDPWLHSIASEFIIR